MPIPREMLERYPKDWRLRSYFVRFACARDAASGSGASFDFWKSWTLEELAEVQGVGPVTDPKALLGGWPGDVDDGFEEEIARIRKSGMIGD